MKAFLDGTASLLAALATIAVCGGPAWFFLAALTGVGLLMTFAFLGNAARHDFRGTRSTVT